MARFSTIQNSFRAGKLSQNLEGRTDIEEYSNGCLEFKNFLALPSGGATKRPGTRFVKEVDKPLALFTWKIGNRFFKIGIPDVEPFQTYANDDFVNALDLTLFDEEGEELPFNPNLISVSDLFTFPTGRMGPIDVAIPKEGWSSTQIGDLLVLTHNSGAIPPIVAFPRIAFQQTAGWYFFHRIPNLPESMRVPYRINFDLEINMAVENNTEGFTFLKCEDASDGAVPYFSSGHDGAIFRFFDADDEGYFRVFLAPATRAANFDHAQNRMDAAAGLGIGGFSERGAIQFKERDGVIPPELEYFKTYFLFNVTGNEFTLHENETDAVTGANPIEFSESPGTGFEEDDIIIIQSSRVPGVVVIPGTPSTLPVSSDSFTDVWRESSWSGHRGWPKFSAIFDNRLVLGGTIFEPDTVWNSLSGNIFHFNQFRFSQDEGSSDDTGFRFFGDPTDSVPFEYFVSAKDAAAITWISAQRTLQIGTVNSEYVVAMDGVYAVGRAMPIFQTSWGSSPIAPANQDLSTLFLSRDGRAIRNFRFNESNGSNISENLSILSEDLVYSGDNAEVAGDARFTRLAWSSSSQTLWLLDNQGQLYSLTVDSRFQVNAWANHDIKGKVHGICIVPRGQIDEVWLVVERDVEGQKFYLEKILGQFFNKNIFNDSDNELDFCVYSDSAVILEDEDNTEWSGLDHLEGKEVVALLDGEHIETATVNGGSITTQNAADEAIIGLPYKSRLRTMPLEGGALIGSSQVLLKRVERAFIKLSKSLGGKQFFGDNGKKYELEYPQIEENETFSGGFLLDIDSTSSERYILGLESDDPLPFNVLSLVMRGEAQE